MVLSLPRMTIDDRYGEFVTVPRAVRFPVELFPPRGFDPGSAETWPKVEGRLEYVSGRLLYMPPCGDVQGATVADVVGVLMPWVRAHPDFLVETNEAGMRLGEDSRGADAAIWRRNEAGRFTGGFRRVPPLLAVEVAGEDEPEVVLRAKADWYLRLGVRVVWLVLPEPREVVVLTAAGVTRHHATETLPTQPELPDLTVPVSALFQQISAQ